MKLCVQILTNARYSVFSNIFLQFVKPYLKLLPTRDLSGFPGYSKAQTGEGLGGVAGLILSWHYYANKDTLSFQNLIALLFL